MQWLKHYKTLPASLHTHVSVIMEGTCGVSTYLETCNSDAYRQCHISQLGSMIGISKRHSTSTCVCITDSLHLHHIEIQMNDTVTLNRERLGLDDIISVLQQNRLRWYGHVLRKEDNDWVKNCMEYEVEDGVARWPSG